MAAEGLGMTVLVLWASACNNPLLLGDAVMFPKIGDPNIAP